MKSAGQNRMKKSDNEISQVSAKHHLRRRQVAQRLNVSVGIVDTWIAQNSGPPFYYAGRIPLFPVDALESWVREQMKRQCRKGEEQDGARLRWLVENHASLVLLKKPKITQPLKPPAYDPRLLDAVRAEIDRWIDAADRNRGEKGNG